MIVAGKLYLRNVAPEYYRMALVSYNKARRFTQRWRSIALYFNQRSNRDIFAVDMKIPAGFFGVITAYLYALAHCEAQNLKPHILVTGKTYRSAGQNENWIENYFTVKTALSPEQALRISQGVIKVTEIRSIDDLGFHKKYKSRLTIDYAHRLLNKYLLVKDDIVEEVDRFFYTNLSAGNPVLGVHYRGTDKFADAPRLTYEALSRKIVVFLERVPDIRQIFIATDEPELLDYLQSNPLPRPVVNFASTQIFRGREAPHFSKLADKYLLGREAMLTCLILARCDYCIRTASYLSGFASVFNPNLRSIMLNDIYDDRFPDAELRTKQFIRL